MSSPLAWIDDELATLARSGLWRELPPAVGRAGAIVDAAGDRLVNFASNDYLGLAADPRLAAAAEQACRETGVGRGASPLVCGRSHGHVELERRLAEFEHAEAALLFPSGYAANVGTLAALVERGDAVFADELNHASLIDGCRLSRAAISVYPHGDAAVLAEQLAASTARRKLIVTDSLFSMDGDLAPLDRIADLAGRHGAMLLVDEAHATGVFGAEGRGACEAWGLPDDDPKLGLVRVGTLSKALGSAGGFVVGTKSLVAWLANRARSYVFSTAHPAAAAAAACAALDVVRDEPQRRVQLLEAAAQLRHELALRGWRTAPSASQIIPVRVGDPGRTVALAASLRRAGYWVGAIRPPSVPPGESLLRICLTASHTGEHRTGLLAAMGTA